MKNRFEISEKSPEISSEALESIKSEVLSQPLECRRFSIEDINYALRICKSKVENGEDNGQPAEYSAQEGEYAIYIWEDLVEKRVKWYNLIV